MLAFFMIIKLLLLYFGLIRLFKGQGACHISSMQTQKDNEKSRN